MASHSFEIRTAKDLFDKLRQEHQDFLQNPLSSRHAINCAISAWHLKEWIWKEDETKAKAIDPTILSEHDFLLFLKKQCPSLELMQGIANGSKHFILDKPNTGGGIKSTKLYEGAFSQGFSRGFDISLLEIELNSGSVIVFEDAIEETILFWNEFFTKHW